MNVRLSHSIFVLFVASAVSAHAYIREETSAGAPLTRTDASSIQVFVNGSLKAGEINADGKTIITASSNPFQSVVNAAAAWTQVSSAAITFAAPAPTTLSNDPTDGKFVITIEDNAANRSVVGSALAVTLFQYNDQTATITDSDIIVNPNVVINGQFTPFATDQSQGAIDLQSVLMHEMGHSLGADHTPVISATMFQSMPPCSSTASTAECTLHQNLSADDIAFATDAYPGPTASQLGEIDGTVAMNDGTAILGALVIAVDPVKGTTIGGISRLQTDNGGNPGTFSLRHLPPGSYEVYAQPLNGPMLPANLSLPNINGANKSFRTTFAGGNATPSSIVVTAGVTSTVGISVDTLTPGMQIEYFGTGTAGGGGRATESDGPKTAPSPGAIDILLWGPGMNASVSASQIRILGPGITLRQNSVRVDPSFPVNGLNPVRLTVDITALASTAPATIVVVNGTDAAAYTGGLALIPAPPGLPVIDAAKKVENAASFIPNQPVAPGSFVAIFGSNFGTGFTLFNSVPIAKSLAGASVTFNGIAAPIIGVTPSQINAQLPWELPSSGTAQVVVTTAAGSSAPVTIPLTSAAPGLFYVATDSTGIARPAAYNNSDGTLPLPPGVVFPPYASRPSKPGEVLILFATGLGAVTNPPADGAPGLASPPYSTTLATPVVLIGGVPAGTTFSGLSPQYPSFYQIAITIPANAPTGNAVPLQIQMNGITTSDQLQIAIAN